MSRKRLEARQALRLQLAISDHPNPMRKLNLSLPRIDCDFNAYALSNELDDNCYYSFRADIDRLASLVGEVVVLFDYDAPSEITACEAVIERHEQGWRGDPERSFWFCGWRARPIDGTWFSGAIPWDNE